MQLPYLQLFFINSRLLTRVPRGPRWIDCKPHPPSSFLFYCEKCGDTFAKFPIIEVATGETLRFQAMTGCCPRCRGGIWVPGSIWCEWEDEYTRILPREILQLELLHHINHTLEEISNGN